MSRPAPNPQSPDASPLFVGVDVGGTNIKVGVVDRSGQILGDDQFPTQPNRSPEEAIAETRRTLKRLVQAAGHHWHDVCAAGLGTPGPLDIAQGTILTPVNLPGWHHQPVQAMLRSALQMPVAYLNDAAAAAFGEHWLGCGKDHSSLVLITLGTGVGGGIIVGDVSIDGAHSHGAEIGHITIATGPDARRCSCGQRGHLEAYASATALVARTAECLPDPRSQLEPHGLTALQIARAAEAGDALAWELILETADYLAAGIATLAHTIDPAIFVLGGAMNFGGRQSRLGQRFLDQVVVKVQNCTFPIVAQNLLIEFASLGSRAGWIGAAGLACHQFGSPDDRRTAGPSASL